MVKILFFIEKLSNDGVIGGAEKVLINLVNNMDQSKFDITIQTLFNDSYARNIGNGINYKYCYSKCNNITETFCRIEAHFGVTYRNRIKDDYDIEVAFLECGSTKVISASTNKKAKKIAWVHCDLRISTKDNIETIRKMSSWYKSFDEIICVSEQCENSFRDIFGNEYNTRVIHNVIDSKEIQLQSQIQLPEDLKKTKFTLCISGRFSPPKNYRRLLNAVIRLKEEGYDFNLWILGDGEQRKMIEQKIADNHLEEYVTLLGFRTNPYPFMKAADLLVCSSDYEGYSTFVTEGLILGKPIITTDCSGMRELLGDSEYGVIVENDDEAFYQGLKKLLTNRSELVKLSRKSIVRSKEFDKDKLTKSVEDFLESRITKNIV